MRRSVIRRAALRVGLPVLVLGAVGALVSISYTASAAEAPAGISTDLAFSFGDTTAPLGAANDGRTADVRFAFINRGPGSIPATAARSGSYFITVTAPSGATIDVADDRLNRPFVNQCESGTAPNVCLLRYEFALPFATFAPNDGRTSTDFLRVSNLPSGESTVTAEISSPLITELNEDNDSGDLVVRL